jgi:hypothetical protein
MSPGQLDNLTRYRNSVGPYVLEVGIPGRPPCPDEAQNSGPSVLLCPRAKVIVVQLSAAAAFVQVGVMPFGLSESLGNVEWQKPRSWLPIAFSLGRDIDAVRVWNRTPGEEAQVSIEAY